MMINQRFSLNDDGFIIDKLNAANNLKVGWDEELGYKKHENCFREMLLWRHLGELLPKLLINADPVQGYLTVRTDRPACKETHSLWPALHRAIKASHLNSVDVSISLQHKFEGNLKREKKGTQAITSLSLFVDDIECVLRDLYGDIDSEALENILYSVFSIAKTFTEYARTDLWIEHVHAMDLDYNFGIGVPEGYGISGREWRRGMRAKVRLYTRACEVRTNTSAFSEYTVEFARRFSEQWMLPDNDLEFLKLSDEMKMGWFTKDIPDDFEEIPF